MSTPIPHTVTVRSNDEDGFDFTVTCPLSDYDATKACAAYIECGCPLATTEVDDYHRIGNDGVLGALTAGCWLVGGEETYDALAELDLAPGDYQLEWAVDEHGRLTFCPPPASAHAA